MNLRIDSYLNVERKQNNVFSNDQNVMTYIHQYCPLSKYTFPNFAQCGSVFLLVIYWWKEFKQMQQFKTSSPAQEVGQRYGIV